MTTRVYPETTLLEHALISPLNSKIRELLDQVLSDDQLRDLVSKNLTPCLRVIFEMIMKQCEPYVSNHPEIKTNAEMTKFVNTHCAAALPEMASVPDVLKIITGYLNDPLDLKECAAVPKSDLFWRNVVKLGRMCLEYRLTTEDPEARYKRQMQERDVACKEEQRTEFERAVQSSPVVQALQATVLDLKRMVEALTQKVRTLEDQLGQNRGLGVVTPAIAPTQALVPTPTVAQQGQQTPASPALAVSADQGQHRPLTFSGSSSRWGDYDFGGQGYGVGRPVRHSSLAKPSSSPKGGAGH